MSASLEALADTLPARGRLLGVDLGTKTIGLAMTDVERRIASPLETLRRSKFTPNAAEILRIVEKFDIVAVVIGLPLNMDGSEGPRAQATRSFARNLAPLIKIPIVYWDERLSTVAVTRTLIEADASRARRGVLVDKLAASFILQGAIDRLGFMANAGRDDANDWAD